MTALRNESLPDSRQEQSPLLTAPEVARLLRLSDRTVRRLDSAGRLPRGLRIGGSKRWRRDELLAWIAAGCPRRTEWTWNGVKGEC
ncbi:MAG: helix-turn-helix domain-containing protein [Planctomycetales bacterium]